MAARHYMNFYTSFHESLELVKYIFLAFCDLKKEVDAHCVGENLLLFAV